VNGNDGSVYGGAAFSFPFLDGGGPRARVRSGELKVAEGPNPDANRLGSFFCTSLPPLPATASVERVGGCWFAVGLPGADVMERGGGG
jgi:hypothetical protein